MSINPIELLKQKVSPEFINDPDGLGHEKSLLLSKFYPIFLSMLVAQPELIEKLRNSLTPSLTDIFGLNEQTKDALLVDLSTSQISVMQAEHTINKAIPKSMDALSDEAGNDSASILHYLRQHMDSIHVLLPGWVFGLLAPLGLVTAGSMAADSQFVSASVAKSNKNGILLPLIALIILGLLLAWWWRSCQSQPNVLPMDHRDNAASSVASPEQALTPAQLSLATNAKGELAQCQIGVGDQGFLATVQASIKQIFSANPSCQVDTTNTYAASFTDQAGLAGVLQLLKGVPDVELLWQGDTITLKGNNASQLNDLLEKIKKLVPNTSVVIEAPVATATPMSVEDSVNHSVNAAGDALANIDQNQVDIQAVIHALNLQIINFATASDQIPDQNKAILDQAATLMKNVKDARLVVSGYTDSTGRADANKVLSQKRAEAVVNYLVGQGVDASQLKAVGHGSDQPVADNNTEEGRFKNRRIEFSVAP